MTTTTSYRARAVRPLGVRQLAGWLIKVYGISARAERPRNEVVAAAVDVAAKTLPRPSSEDPLDGYGFVIAHDDDSACRYLVFWWVQQIFLRRRIYVAPTLRPRAVQPMRDEVFPSAWELVPVAHEREAWVSAMLVDQPDPTRYLSDTVSRDT